MWNSISYKIKKSSFESGLFVILLCLLSTYKIGNYANSKLYSNGMFALGCIMVMVALIKKRNNHGIDKKDEYSTSAYTICLIFFLMQVIMQIYAYILAFLGYTSFDLLSTNAYSFIPPLFAWACLSLYKEKTIELFTKALIYNFVFTSIINVIIFGPEAITQVFYSVISGNVTTVTRVFEVHGNSFAIGVLFLYYLFNPGENKRKKYIIFLLIASFFGQKRIQFAAMALCCGLFYIDKLLKKGRLAKKSRFSFLQGIMVVSIVLCLVYAKIALDGTLSLLLIGLGVNDSYRSFMYGLMRDHAYFGPGFLGIGRNAAGRIVGQYYQAHYDSVITNLHSDLLKMYVENGFWLYIAWLAIYLVYLPQKIKTISNYETALKSILFVMYMFVLYLTDNVESYMIVQTVFLVSLITTVAKGIKQKRFLN